MIEYNNIYDGLFYVVKEAIGDHLSVGTNGQPMIYEFGNGGEWGTYPFVIIERGSTVNRDGVLNLNEYFDDNDHFVTERAKVVQYFIRIIGSNAANTEGEYRSATEIASIFEGYFSTSKARDTFRDNTDCSELGLILSSTPSYKPTGDQIYESCNVAITVDTTLTHTNTTPDLIETVNVDGEVKRKQEDTNPLSLNVSVTT